MAKGKADQAELLIECQVWSTNVKVEHNVFQAFQRSGKISL